MTNIYQKIKFIQEFRYIPRSGTNWGETSSFLFMIILISLIVLKNFELFPKDLNHLISIPFYFIGSFSFLFLLFSGIIDDMFHFKLSYFKKSKERYKYINSFDDFYFYLVCVQELQINGLKVNDEAILKRASLKQKAIDDYSSRNNLELTKLESNKLRNLMVY